MKKTLLSLFVAAATVFGANSQVQNYANGDAVTDFTVTDVHGNTHTLSDITSQGKWVVIDFFFTTCGPCQQLAPTFSELHQKYGCNTSDLFCISIDTGDGTADVQNFETQYAMSGGFTPSPAVSGTDGGGNAVVSNFGVSAFPTFCLIGPDMTMKANDIWPAASVSAFESAFSQAGFTPTEATCPSNSIDELSLAHARTFPNPSNGNVTVSFEASVAGDVTMQVTNLLGQVVYTSVETVNGGVNAVELDLDELSNGQYILTIANEATTMTSNIQIRK